MLGILETLDEVAGKKIYYFILCVQIDQWTQYKDYISGQLVIVIFLLAQPSRV